MIDQIFTPPDLAGDLVELAAVGGRELGTVADFAVGDGALLRAAIERQPSVEVVGLDINRATIHKLQATNSSWQIGACDFLNPRSRASSPVLRRSRGRVSTALLNPPFTCRGGRREHVTLKGQRLTCSVAMAFILTALDYLTPSGVVVAVAPRGIEKSEKDAAAWEVLRSMGTAEIVGYRDRGAFPGTALRSLLLRFTMGPLPHRRPACARPVATQHKRPSVSLVRGTVQMHRAHFTNAGMPLIHTTDLSDGQLSPEHRRTSAPGRKCRGPVVLIPRVGRPKLSKVVRTTLPHEVTLSDCVIALECASEDDSLRVRQVIEDRWDEFEESYGGSCAPYVTLKALRDLLGRFGFPSELGGGSPMPDGDATTSQVAVTRSPILLDGLHEAPYPSEARRGLDEDEGGVPVGDRPEAARR